MKLLARLANDGRVDVRAQAARALGWFVDAYPDRVEELLLLLACDSSRKVRAAAAESLADLIPRANDPWELIEQWNAHPDRAREVLQSRAALAPSPARRLKTKRAARRLHFLDRDARPSTPVALVAARGRLRGGEGERAPVDSRSQNRRRQARQAKAT